MSGKAPRQKGDRFERFVVNTLQAAGLAAERVPLSGAAGGSYTGDLTCPVLCFDKKFECKTQANGFKFIYDSLGENYGLCIRADRKETLVVLRLDDFARLARGVAE